MIKKRRIEYAGRTIVTFRESKDILEHKLAIQRNIILNIEQEILLKSSIRVDLYFPLIMSCRNRYYMKQAVRNWYYMNQAIEPI